MRFIWFQKGIQCFILISIVLFCILLVFNTVEENIKCGPRISKVTRISLASVYPNILLPIKRSRQLSYTACTQVKFLDPPVPLHIMWSGAGGSEILTWEDVMMHVSEKWNNSYVTMWQNETKLWIYRKRYISNFLIMIDNTCLSSFAF